MADVEEKRSFPRFNLLVDVTVTKRVPTPKEENVTTKNISQGGVCIISYERPEVGEMVNMNIRLPGIKDEIKTMAKVVWVKEFSIGPLQKTVRYEVGFAFVGLSDPTFEMINKYLYNSQSV